MAGNNSIQILRGNTAACTATSLVGQPIWNNSTGYLYIGDGTSAINTLDAINANYANNANYATNSNHANVATNANYATNSGYATNANYATNSGFATNANYATNAGYSDNANYATNANRATYANRFISNVNLRVNLNATACACFNTAGTYNIGVTGVLPATHGGTGRTTGGLYHHRYSINVINTHYTYVATSYTNRTNACTNSVFQNGNTTTSIYLDCYLPTATTYTNVYQLLSNVTGGNITYLPTGWFYSVTGGAGQLYLSPNSSNSSNVGSLGFYGTSLALSNEGYTQYYVNRFISGAISNFTGNLTINYGVVLA